MRYTLLCLVVVSLFACGSLPSSSDDAGSTADRWLAPCAADLDCDDGLFCTGTERCMPALASADARGCVQAVSPCREGQSCDDARDVCTTDCTVTRDADGDSVEAVECGGGDCDDSDPARFPGATEVCDVDGRDEDCDPSTFGFRDGDGDSYPDAACCNGEVCGTDCDDANPAVNPGAVDACDRGMRDEDCSGVPNDRPGGCACLDGDSAACEEGGVCAAGTRTCVDGRLSDCSIQPQPETCNGLDDDCDGARDEGLAVMCWPDADGDDLAPAGSSPVATCPDPVRMGSPWFGCPANRVGVAPDSPDTTDCDDGTRVVSVALSCHADADDDSYGAALAERVCPRADGVSCPDGYVASADDCCDADAAAHPGVTAYFATPSLCGNFDYDCSGGAEYELSGGVACGVFTVGEPACTSRNTQFMMNPHYDINVSHPCGATVPYITGCTWSGGCMDISTPRVLRCR